MYRRDIYLKMGGFVTKTIFNEDMIMAANMVQAGYQIAYAAEAKQTQKFLLLVQQKTT